MESQLINAWHVLTTAKIQYVNPTAIFANLPIMFFYLKDSTYVDNAQYMAAQNVRLMKIKPLYARNAKEVKLFIRTLATHVHRVLSSISWHFSVLNALKIVPVAQTEYVPGATKIMLATTLMLVWILKNCK